MAEPARTSQSSELKGADGTVHLEFLKWELALPEDATFEDVIDVVLLSLAKTIATVHESRIVHPDMKPAKLLCDRTLSRGKI